MNDKEVKLQKLTTKTKNHVLFLLHICLEEQFYIQPKKTNTEIKIIKNCNLKILKTSPYSSSSEVLLTSAFDKCCTSLFITKFSHYKIFKFCPMRVAKQFYCFEIKGMLDSPLFSFTFLSSFTKGYTLFNKGGVYCYLVELS